MHRKEKIEKIAELFARFRTEVESLNSLNLYDINVHAENVIIPILNLVYGVNLVNINNRVRNSAAIDLVDTENRIAVQVTPTSTGDKVKHTINEFVGVSEELPNPYGKPLTAYGECFEILTGLIDKLADKLNSYAKGEE